MDSKHIIELIATAFELVGVGILVLGSIIAFVHYLVTLIRLRKNHVPYRHLRLDLGRGVLSQGTEQAVGGLISAGFNILITAVVSVYLLVDGYRFGHWQKDSSLVSQRGWISAVQAIVQRVVGGYIRGQIVMSACIGVPYAVLIGAMAFVSEFIAVMIASTQSQTLALITLAYTIAVDCKEGYVLSPRIMSKAVEIWPVVSLLGMIAGTKVFGIWGGILAAPMIDLFRALVGAYWQQYQKTHAKEFPPEEIEQATKPKKESAKTLVKEPDGNGPLS